MSASTSQLIGKLLGSIELTLSRQTGLALKADGLSVIAMVVIAAEASALLLTQ